MSFSESVVHIYHSPASLQVYFSAPSQHLQVHTQTHKQHSTAGPPQADFGLPVGFPFLPERELMKVSIVKNCSGPIDS